MSPTAEVGESHQDIRYPISVLHPGDKKVVISLESESDSRKIETLIREGKNYSRGGEIVFTRKEGEPSSALLSDGVPEEQVKEPVEAICEILVTERLYPESETI